MLLNIRTIASTFSPAPSAEVYGILLLLLQCIYLFQCTSVVWEMDEELPVNTSIKSLRQSIPGLMGASNIQFYKIAKEEHASYFHVDPKSGVVSVAQRIDREALCPEKLMCELKFSVHVRRDSRMLDSVDVRVKLNDINDNPCSFSPSDSQVILISEDAKPQTTRVSLYSPQDMDVSHSIQGNHISLSNVSPEIKNLFSLHHEAIVSSLTIPWQLELVLMQPLDYEKVRSYAFLVHAGDGTPKHSCNLLVNITVIDVNDNPPKFEKPSYLIEVPEEDETVLPTKHVLTVRATDLDSGQYGEVEYYIPLFVEKLIQNTFRIDSQTGQLFLLTKLNYQQRASYEIPIRARNPGSSSSSSYGSTVVQVHVIDINNHRPDIRITNLIGEDQLTISENTLGEVDVGFLSAEDKDTGRMGEVSCEMDYCQVQNSLQLKPLESANQAKYRIIAKQSFDRELISSIQFQVTCRDGGDPPLASTKAPTLYILDENDNAPHFPEKTNSSGYFVSVYEDSHPQREENQFFVVHVKAADPDEGENATITYRIVNLPDILQDLFYMETKSGKLYSTGKLDREIAPMNHPFTLEIEARDQGAAIQYSSSVKVVITLVDFNDNSPQCERFRNVFKVDENMNAPLVLGEIITWDDDIGENGEYSVTLDKYSPIRFGEDGKIALQHFNVSRGSSGSLHYNRSHRLQHIQLIMTKSIDRESFISSFNHNTTVQLNMSLLLRDNGSPSHKSSCIVVVEIQDQNDNAPQFVDFIHASNYTMELSNMEAVAYEFATIKAVDPDAGLNGKVTYRVLSQDPQQYFYLDPITGKLSLAKLLPHGMTGIHVLKVEASDRGQPVSLTNTTFIYVNVTDIPPRGPPSYGTGGLRAVDLESTINLYIIVAIVVSSLMISLVLLSAICVVLRRSKGLPSNHYSTDVGDGLMKDENGVSPYLLGDGNYILAPANAFPAYQLGTEDDRDFSQTLTRYTTSVAGSGTMRITPEMCSRQFSPAYDYCPTNGVTDPYGVRMPQRVINFSTLTTQGDQARFYGTVNPYYSHGLINLATFKENVGGDQDSGKGDSLDANRPSQLPGVSQPNVETYLQYSNGNPLSGSLQAFHLPCSSTGDTFQTAHSSTGYTYVATTTSPLTVHRPLLQPSSSDTKESPWLLQQESLDNVSTPASSLSSQNMNRTHYNPIQRFVNRPVPASSPSPVVSLLLRKEGDSARSVPVVSVSPNTGNVHCSKSGEGSFV